MQVYAARPHLQAELRHLGNWSERANPNVRSYAIEADFHAASTRCGAARAFHHASVVEARVDGCMMR